LRKREAYSRDYTKKIFKGMSEDELEAVIREIEGRIEQMEGDDPYWWFEPTRGEIGEREREFLERYLKPEDIPEKVDGQADAFKQPRGIVGVSGGNQSGKSVFGAIRGYIRSVGELPEALSEYEELYRMDIERARKKFIRGRVVGVDFKQLHNTVLPAWQRWAPRKYLKNGRWSDSFSAQHNRLTLWRGGKACAQIEFMTNKMDVDTFQGPPLDWVVFDEEPREDIYRENLLRFTTSDSLDMDFCFTPTKGITWTADLFEGDGADRTHLYKLCSINNPKANLDVLEAILDEITDYEELKMRLLGEFVSLSGLVYGKAFDRKVHVIEPFFEKLNPAEKADYLCLYGCDPHTVTEAALVFVLVDRELNFYVDRCYFRLVSTDELKQDFHDIVSEAGYRVGWGVADKSADSNIIAFGGRNIFRELKMGDNALPGLRTSIKYEGSIKAGVDEIKKLLKAGRFFIVNRPENKALIRSFQTLQRDTYSNEDLKGKKDRIAEGRHHLHAALRYIFQFPINWYPEDLEAPEALMIDEVVVG